MSDSILRIIWRTQRISRADIAREANISRSTVSEIIRGLLATDLVEEVGAGPSRGGRRPIVLAFRDDSYSILGVEMGATHVTVVLTDLRGRILASAQRKHPVRNDPEGTRELIKELADACIARAGGRAGNLLGIGIAVPSPVDPTDPFRLSPVILPAWEGRSDLASLESRYGVPVLIANDANLGALAERWWGRGIDVNHFAYVKLGTGVGAGHVIEGEMYHGATGVAGEIGHLAIDPQGGPCVCGLRGCLTTFVGSEALVARADELLPDYPASILSEGAITIDLIEDAALARDPLALRIAEEAAEHLGIAIAGMLNMMNPSMVILGGGLARLGDLLLTPLGEIVRKRTFVSSVSSSSLRISELGPLAGALGGSTLVLKTGLSDPRFFTSGLNIMRGVV